MDMASKLFTFTFTYPSQQLKSYAAHPSRGARHHEELEVSGGRPASLGMSE